MKAKCDIVLAGVGGQGVLSISVVIATGAMLEGLHVKQCETHGMSQRGGAVMTHLRLSSDPIASDLIPIARADIILSMEPLESLRYLPYLGKGGTLITATTPVVNIPSYPPLDELLARIAAMPSALLVDCDRLAREAGAVRASNMVLVGATSHRVPVHAGTIERAIKDVFGRKGTKAVETNLKAFHLGRDLAATAPDQEIEAQGG